jgi:hypothetical protein
METPGQDLGRDVWLIAGLIARFAARAALTSCQQLGGPLVGTAGQDETRLALKRTTPSRLLPAPGRDHQGQHGQKTEREISRWATRSEPLKGRVVR